MRATLAQNQRSPVYLLGFFAFLIFPSLASEARSVPVRNSCILGKPRRNGRACGRQYLRSAICATRSKLTLCADGSRREGSPKLRFQNDSGKRTGGKPAGHGEAQ